MMAGCLEVGLPLLLLLLWSGILLRGCGLCRGGFRSERGRNRGTMGNRGDSRIDRTGRGTQGRGELIEAVGAFGHSGTEGIVASGADIGVGRGYRPGLRPGLRSRFGLAKHIRQAGTRGPLVGSGGAGNSIYDCRVMAGICGGRGCGIRGKGCAAFCAVLLPGTVGPTAVFALHLSWYLRISNRDDCHLHKITKIIFKSQWDSLFFCHGLCFFTPIPPVFV